MVTSANSLVLANANQCSVLVTMLTLSQTVTLLP